MNQIKLHPFQWQTMQSEKRFVAMIAGSGGGKTHFGPVWLAQEIQKYPKDTFLIVAPTFKMLQRTVIPKIELCFKGTFFEGELKETKLQYLLPNNGIIYFGSADNPDSLEGVHVRAAWLDEASLMSRDLWIVVQGRLGRHQGRCLITTTPRAFNWLYHDFYRRFLDGDKDFDVIQFRSIDNPHYPREEFDRMRNALDSRIFEMRYCGQFRKMSGLVYPDFGPESIVDNTNRNFIEVRYGVDWGYNNPAVILALGADNDGVWYLLDEWCERGKLLDDVIIQAQAMQKRYGIGVFYCDPSQPAYIDAFNKNGLPTLGADNSIPPGIQAVGMLIKTKCLKVSRSCKNTIEEFETYHYPEDAKKDLPVKEDDHCMDALRYAIRGEGTEEVEEEIIIFGEDIGLERVKIGEDY